MADALIGGAVVGALVSELLKKLITEAKKVLEFEPVSKELASTMEDLHLIIIEIVSQKPEELKSLKVTIDKAEELVKRCSCVKKWEVIEKHNCTKKVRKIQKEMVSFCQVQVPLLQLRTQLQSTDDILKKLDNMRKDIDRNLQVVNEMLNRLREEMKIVSENVNLLREETKNIPEIFSEKVIEKLGPLVPAPIYRYLCSVPKLGTAPVGFDWPLTHLKKKLLDDSVDSLLVSGAPGCGKTKLVTQLCHNEDIKKEFKHIFFNVVSSAPNFRKLVHNLLQHNGEDPPVFDNDIQAIYGLQKLLQKLREDGPILMVLDDVWHGSESLITDFRTKIPNYKILVTSRSDFTDFSFTYDLKPLEDKYAKDLLIECAPQPDEASQAEYDFFLEKIMKGCNGFPLVIKVVGSSLKGKPKYVWKGQVDSWSLGETILDNDGVLKCLEPSYNALKPRPKECFLDMGSFLEDQKIRASVIIDIRVELDGKGSGTMYMKYLNDLASHHLLTLIPLGRKEPEDGFYNEFLVTQHDVLRELAIRQSVLEAILDRKRLNLEIREDEFPDWCVDLKKPTVNARLLSISTDDKFSSNWVEMDCPYVEALVLNISSLDYALPSFISTMRKLKVVVIINHGLYPARLSGFSSLSSLKHLKRIRLEKVSITFLDIVPLQCISLKKLSLVMCSFGEVFYDAEEINVFKAPPSLEEIDIDNCYDLVELPFWVSEVVSLKTLSVTNCNKLSILPEAIGNLSKLEVLRLCSCINLSKLPETTSELNNMRYLDISYCQELKKLPLNIGKLQKLKMILMRNWSGELPESVMKLENLVVKCSKETTIAGAGASEIVNLLKLLIAEAKLVLEFKYLSEDLATTMEELRPTLENIELLRKPDELTSLKDTIADARVLVTKCSSVKKWEVHKKSYYTRKVWKIQKKMVLFCQVQLQLIQHKNQLDLMEEIKKLNVLTEKIDSNHQIFVKMLDLLMQEMSENHQTVIEKHDLVSVHAPESRDLCLVPRLGKAPVGFDLPLIDLKKKLLDDSVESLLVSGPPGCGKTKLVTQLCHDEDIKRNFKHIFFNVVSSTPNLRKLLQNLFEHNGYQAFASSENDSETVVALEKLLNTLKGEGILLVLDDVWYGADSLLEKLSIDIPDLKILMTSRFHFSGLDSTYHLKPLEDEEAKALLSQWASKPYHASPIEYEDLLQKILGRCNGFPLIIEALGNSLKGQSLTFWKAKVDIWSNGETLLDNPILLECLQPSFNALDPNLNKCFLDMSLFIEDQAIRASSIVDIWAELYGKGSIVLMEYLEELASQNLLQLVSRGRNEHEDSFYSEFLVTQYSILRELAIHQSEKEIIHEKKRLNLNIRDDKFPDWCSNLKQPINARLLSISTDKSFSSKWIHMDFPNVEALVLHASSSDYALPSFIAGMTNLKILTVTYHKFNLAKFNNFSCLSSLPKLKRIRLEKALLTSFNILQLRLTSLKKLSLVKCEFGEVFYDMDEIVASKALPTLEEIDIDYCYDLVELPFWIFEVVSLKILSITNCNKLSKLPEELGNLGELEVLRLNFCKNLLELPETTARLNNLRFLDISDCTEMRKLPLEIGKLQMLKKISMRSCWRCALPKSVKKNLEVTQ